jgi:hypothetical protein
MFGKKKETALPIIGGEDAEVEIENFQETEENEKPASLVKEILTVPAYAILALSLMLNILLMDILVFSDVTTIKMFFIMTTPIYAWSSIVLTIFLAIVIGFALTQLFFLFHRYGTWRGWGLIVLGGDLATLSIGCPDCGSPLVTNTGIAGGLSSFPLQGLELKLIAGLLLWSGLKSSSRYYSETNAENLIPSRDGDPVEQQKSYWSLWRANEALLMVGAILAFYALPLLPAPTKVDFSASSSTSSNNSSSIRTVSSNEVVDINELLEQVVPAEGFSLSVEWGDLGPQLLEAGAIDYERFVKTYEDAGAPLSDAQLAILTEGSNEAIQVNRDNAYFLLNFFWAFGLTNQNPILDEGPITTYGDGEIGNFASTGGWTLGQKPATELFSSTAIIQLAPDEQLLVESVAGKVFRPCCNNPTIFPDCNHGMAMLGLLELLASQGATEDEMLETAKIVNAYWFPQQAIEVATYFQATDGKVFSELDAETVIGPEYFSGSGFRTVHEWLGSNGLLETVPNQGGSCGV